MSPRSVRALAVTAGLATILALAACTPTSGPTPSGSDAADSPSASATPSATSEPAGPVFALPADCTSIASTATLNTVFSGVASRPANGLTRPAPASAAKTLECSWFTGDVTGGDVIYYSAPAADSAAYLAVVTSSGFTCASALGGMRCDKVTPNSQYPVNLVETVFTRDDVWIYLGMSNVPSDPLLPDIVATAWAA